MDGRRYILKRFGKWKRRMQWWRQDPEVVFPWQRTSVRRGRGRKESWGENRAQMPHPSSGGGGGEGSLGGLIKSLCFPRSQRRKPRIDAESQPRVPISALILPCYTPWGPSLTHYACFWGHLGVVWTWVLCQGFVNIEAQILIQGTDVKGLGFLLLWSFAHWFKERMKAMTKVVLLLICYLDDAQELWKCDYGQGAQGGRLTWMIHSDSKQSTRPKRWLQRNQEVAAWEGLGPMLLSL